MQHSQPGYVGRINGISTSPENLYRFDHKDETSHAKSDQGIKTSSPGLIKKILSDVVLSVAQALCFFFFL